MSNPGNTTRKPGDPTPASAAQVLIDPAYKFVSELDITHRYITLTVFHCGTERYWQTMYDVSNLQNGAMWWEVRPQPRTIIEYVRVP